MGDSAGEKPQCLHLLGPSQLLFLISFFGDVFKNAYRGIDVAIGIHQGAQQVAQNNGLLPTAGKHRLISTGGTTFQAGPELSRKLRGFDAGGLENVDLQQGLPGGRTEDLGKGGVDVDDRPVAIDGDDAKRCIFHQGTKPPFTDAQGFFSLFPLGHILGDDQPVFGATVSAGNGQGLAPERLWAVIEFEFPGYALE
jgi:hypothetical protein